MLKLCYIILEIIFYHHISFSSPGTNQTHLFYICLARQKASTFQPTPRHLFFPGKVPRPPTKHAPGIVGQAAARVVVLWPCLVQKIFLKSATVAITSNIAIRAWNIKCRRKKN